MYRSLARCSPPYELYCVVRKKTNPNLLVKTMKDLATYVINEGGGVSSFKNLGSRPLPKPLKGKVELGKTREIHKQAHFTTMDFDAAPKVLEPLREHLEQNPEILRYRILEEE